jgi:translation initiation factor 1
LKEKETRLVYTTDPKMNQKCKKCREFVSECACASEADIKKSPIIPVLRIEKSGRCGKVVTVIDRLPGNESYLKDIAKTLKERCGSGGTYKREGAIGSIEIQGDKREQIRGIFSKIGINCKG